ncbi:Transcription regulator Rrf2-like [Syntrophomonas zehnderi OL-4]|uniref:Transcription regulator Rrf2-like n=1 Tax=Syntrophomonas zehnderi OL-4 TaxID=690567 RepID=A0A0E4GAC4_9FIRM|nr:Rrf2 family transcriptional regulator [Syntrophomonas zehnderi]CFX41700.1 Transcription regulator Rrf2-like [Syntrophomonas zehnderi OL-4]
MKLSTKGRYGLRAMLDMALSEGNGPIASHTIAQRQDISERYLEQLLIPLKQAGLIKSIRGSQGGYVLGRSPRDISVGEIIRVLEGPLAPVDCVNELNPEDCKRSAGCVTRPIWIKVRDAIAAVLDSYTLEDLVYESQQMSAPTSAASDDIKT